MNAFEKFVIDNPEKPWNWAGLSRNQMNKYEFPLCVMKRRAKERIDVFKEELMAAAWHPNRVEKLVDHYGMEWDEYI